MQRIVEGHQRFVSEVAHEIKSPLTGIQGNLELLLRYDWLQKEERQEVVTEAHREVVRLGRLVADLLSTARSGHEPLLLDTEVRFHEMLLLTVKDFEHQKGKHRLEQATIEPCVVCGDPDRLKQLLIILISNALKYTPDGGTVSFSLRKEGDFVVLSIQDTGVGIPSEDLEKVFERHHRAKITGMPDPGGHGLGLPIAKWIVEQHGGSIHLESVVGVGTTVWVKLPLVQK